VYLKASQRCGVFACPEHYGLIIEVFFYFERGLVVSLLRLFFSAIAPLFNVTHDMYINNT